MSTFAYLDAGTGSLIIQAVVGAVLGIGVFLRTFWSRIIKLFKRKDPNDEHQKTAVKTTVTKAKSGKSSE